MLRIKDSMLLNTVLSFLNENNVKFKVCHYSPAHTEEEIEQEVFRLGMGMMEAVPLDIGGAELMLAVIPASLAVDFANLSSLLAPRKVRPLSPEEIHQRFSLTHSTNIPPFGCLFGAETLLSPLIEQHNMVGFFVDDRSTMITLEASEFRRVVGDGSAIPVPTRTKYRAYASPGRKNHEQCILGVSLENTDFLTTKLITITDWISKHYDHCIVMLGDGLHRITVQMDSGLPEYEAMEHSKWLGRDFIHSQLSVFKLRESSCQFDFVFSSDIQKSQAYLDNSHYLEALSLENTNLQDSIRFFSEDFLRRKPQRQKNADKHLAMSSHYLMEELTVLSCLAQDVPWTFVYPGSLTILKEIAEGKHPDVPPGLLQMDYVELKIKSR